MERQDFQKINSATTNALTEKAVMNMQRNQIARNKASIYVVFEDALLLALFPFFQRN
jgi:hypothetical protein